MKAPLGSKQARKALLTAFGMGVALYLLGAGFAIDMASGGQVWGVLGDIPIVILNFLTPTNIVIISVFAGLVALFTAE